MCVRMCVRVCVCVLCVCVRLLYIYIIHTDVISLSFSFSLSLFEKLSQNGVFVDIVVVVYVIRVVDIFARLFQVCAYLRYQRVRNLFVRECFEQSFYLSRASSDEYDGSIVWIDFNRVGPFVYFKHS